MGLPLLANLRNATLSLVVASLHSMGSCQGSKCGRQNANGRTRCSGSGPGSASQEEWMSFQLFWLFVLGPVVENRAHGAQVNCHEKKVRLVRERPTICTRNHPSLFRPCSRFQKMSSRSGVPHQTSEDEEAEHKRGQSLTNCTTIKP